jgi:hypothetical protein
MYLCISKLTFSMNAFCVLINTFRVVMKTESVPLAKFNEKNPKPVIPMAKWNSHITKFYDRYCTGEAQAKALEDATSDPPKTSPQLSNLLLQLQDFSEVVEANQAMQAGDIGRMLNMWKMWSVMSQGLKGLNSYSSYLPKTVLLLTKLLPESFSKLFRHSLLFSPSGRDDHYLSKDGYLQIQNYWLKHVYNNSGQGTQIDWLKDKFSLNIHLVS